jgi:putative hydrolase of the HAD superfamily
MGHSPLRAVAFDLFHTLVDPEEYRPREFQRARAVADLLHMPQDEFAAYWASELPSRLVTLRPTVLERVQAFCHEKGIFPLKSVWPEVNDILGRYQDQAILHPHPTMLATLRALKEAGWTLGLISNCDEREMMRWPESEQAPLFDGTVFSCVVGAAKPSVEAYESLIARWGGAPLAAAAFVGDGNSDELAGARRAGFAKVVFQAEFVSKNGLRPASANEALAKDADVTISDIRELPRILPSLPGRASDRVPR